MPGTRSSLRRPRRATSSAEAKIDVLGQPAGSGVVDRPLTTGRSNDRSPADPMADPARARAPRSGRRPALRPVSWEIDLSVLLRRVRRSGSLVSRHDTPCARATAAGLRPRTDSGSSVVADLAFRHVVDDRRRRRVAVGAARHVDDGDPDEKDRAPDRDSSRDDAACRQTGGGSRIAPGRRDRGPGECPQPDREVEKTSIATSEAPTISTTARTASIASVAIPSYA